MAGMSRFCVHCRKEVPTARVARDHVLSDACRRQDRMERRRARAGKDCRYVTVQRQKSRTGTEAPILAQKAILAPGVTEDPNRNWRGVRRGADPLP